MNKPISQLRNVFGTMSHEPPAPPAGVEPEVEEPPVADETADGMGSAVISDRTGLVLQPNLRFDGDPDSPPWNHPEPEICAWLAEQEIELVEERIFFGAGGNLWARMRDDKGQLRSVFLKMYGVGHDYIYEHYGHEFLLDKESHDLAKRELAAYEVAKACGCEDLVPPMAGKDVNLVPLLSDAMREKLARYLKISPVHADEKLGIAAVVQVIPHSADSFLEHWAQLGPDQKSRWKAASDRLRHSIYRAIALDFILGVPERSMASYLYNRNTDRIAITDLCLSFPHPGYSAEKYLQLRTKGWGRPAYSGLVKPAEAGPASGWDTHRLLDGAEDEIIDECMMTFEQVVAGIPDENARHLAAVLMEQQMPVQCVTGVFARISFMTIEPDAVVKRPVEFMRNVMAPMRRGFGLEEERNAQLIQYVNQIVEAYAQQPIEFESVAQEDFIETVHFTI